jgi:hypothetical protein
VPDVIGVFILSLNVNKMTKTPYLLVFPYFQSS